MAAEARVMSESLELAANRPENRCARALAELRRFRGPVLVDLDETLFLRNSTEDFIDTARPGILALLLMRLLDVLRPWRWSGGERTRDVWRVRLHFAAASLDPFGMEQALQTPGRRGHQRGADGGARG